VPMITERTGTLLPKVQQLLILEEFRFKFFIYKILPAEVTYDPS
jgi:hypothetical protein